MQVGDGVFPPLQIILDYFDMAEYCADVVTQNEHSALFRDDEARVK